jgi:hypothetical protein
MIKCPDRHLLIPNELKVEKVGDKTDYGKFILQQKNKNTTNIPKEEVFKNMTKYSLFTDYILNKDIDILYVLNSIKDTALRGNVYEALWDIVVKYDELEHYNSERFVHIEGKIENSGLIDPNIITNTTSYLKKQRILTGKSSGISDITMKEKAKTKNDTRWACERTIIDKELSYILFSVKYYNVEKSVDKYDIENIIQVMERYRGKNKDITINYKIVLLVRDKTEFLKILNRMKHYKYYYKIDIDLVYDVNDLVGIINKMRNNVKYHNINSKTDIKPKLSGRFHQLLFVNKTIDKIRGRNQQQPLKRLLWGQIARSGKTYCAGLLISKLDEENYFHDTSRILIITPAPTETLEQFTKELILKFDDFKDFELIVYNGSFKKDDFKQTRKTIFICSKQYLQGVGNNNDQEKDSYKMIEKVQEKCAFFKNTLKLIIFDEIHYGGTTDISQQILKELDPNENAFQLYLTATYKKPVLLFNLNENEIMTWGLNEIQMAKYISSVESRDNLYSLYGRQYVTDTINELCINSNYTLDEIYTNIEDEYRKYPVLHIITSQFDTDKIQDIVANNPNLYGFDINSVFQLNSTNDAFINEFSLHNILNYIGNMSDPRSVYNRMNNTLGQYNQHRSFTSQLWFLPYYEQNKIKNIAPTFQKLIEQNINFKDFSVISIIEAKQNKNTIKTEEINAMQNGKRGLIILVGKKFSLGVSLPCVDSVFFLNNDIEVDVIYQRMFRSLTESYGKRIGFVIDLNPYRTIHTVLDYSSNVCNNKDTEKATLKTTLLNKTIFIDEDLITFSNTNTKPLSYKTLYDNIEQLIEKNQLSKNENEMDKILQFSLMSDISKYMKEFYKLFKTVANKQHKIALVENHKNVGKGQKREKPKDKDKKDNIQKIQLFLDNFMMLWKDVMFLMALFDEERSFEDTMKHMIAYETYNDIDILTKIIYDKFSYFIDDEDPFDVFKYMIRELTSIFNENNLFPKYNRYLEDMKNDVANLDNPEALHGFVEKHLPPKTFEKKNYGEVFTPLTLVREMLDAVEKYGDKGFWTNKQNRILDPAAGIGNFPLIAYEKLMEGLKDKIKNEEERRKHILKNMLFMVELNPNNIKLMKRIFRGYKINVIEGDFLSDETKAKMETRWGGKVQGLKFDLVMGNPPFQKPVRGTRRGGYGGTSLWDKFVIRILDKNGFMKQGGLFSFINPSSWRKPESEIRTIYDKYDMIYLKINSENEGNKHFDAGTRFDWYIIKCAKNKNFFTIISDEDNKVVKIVFDKWKFIPNGYFSLFNNLFNFSQRNTFDVIYSRSAYGTDKKWINKEKINEYKYPVVHTLNNEGIGLVYSSHNDKGHFGVSKVLLTFGRHQYPYNDYKGEYGMSQIIYGLPIKNKKEGDDIVKAINSETFKTILKYSKWNIFNTDWRMFKYLKTDFYKML